MLMGGGGLGGAKYDRRILEQPLSFIAYLGNELRNDWSSRVYLTPDWLRGYGLVPIQNIGTSGATCHLRSSELSRPVRGCTYITSLKIGALKISLSPYVIPEVGLEIIQTFDIKVS